MEWELELSGAEVLAFALAIACGSLIVALAVLWKRSPRAAGAHDTATELDGLRQTIGQLEGELSRLVQDMNGRIDTKMRVLRGLLDGADAAVRQLRQLQIPTSPAGAVTRSFVARESSNQPADSELDPTTTCVGKSRDAARLVSAPARPDVAVPPEPIDDRAQRYSHVYSLADAGLSSSQISAETGMHRGEVELVLNLRRKKVRVDRAGRPEPAHLVSNLEEATV